MLIFGNSKFAENKTEMIDSLFETGGTCTGYAKRNKREIKLFNIQNELFAVINRYGLLCSAIKMENNKYWYTFASSKLTEDIGEINHKNFVVSYDFNNKYSDKQYCYK